MGRPQGTHRDEILRRRQHNDGKCLHFAGIPCSHGHGVAELKTFGWTTGETLSNDESGSRPAIERFARSEGAHAHNRLTLVTASLLVRTPARAEYVVLRSGPAHRGNRLSTVATPQLQSSRRLRRTPRQRSVRSHRTRRDSTPSRAPRSLVSLLRFHQNAEKHHGVDGDLIAASSPRESIVHPTAISRKNPRGLMQTPSANRHAPRVMKTFSTRRENRSRATKYHANSATATTTTSPHSSRLKRRVRSASSNSKQSPYRETVSYVRRVGKPTNAQSAAPANTSTSVRQTRAIPKPAR